MFNVELSSQAAKFLKKAEKDLAARIIQRLERLSDDPFPSDVKRVVNKITKESEKIFRIRIGDYRVQYCVIYEKNTVLVTEIEKRPRAY